MKKYHLTIGLMLGCFLLLARCSKYRETTVGANFYERDNIGSEAHWFAYAQHDTTYQTTVPTGAEIFLFAGHHKDLQCQTLLHFSALPDSGVVDSVFFTYNIDSTHGSFPGLIAPSVYMITGDWEESEITWKMFYDGGLMGDKVATEVVTIDEDSIRITFPAHIMQSWMDTTTTDNHGILLTYPPPDTGFITQFYSKEGPIDWIYVPHMIIHVTHDTVQSTYERYPMADAFIASSPFTQNANQLHIADATALRTLLYFDVASIPQNATINNARLTLYGDTTLSFPDHSGAFYVMAWVTNDTTWWSSIETVSFDSTLSFNGKIEGDSVSIDLTYYVQNWTIGTKENYGLLLRGGNERSNIRRRIFHSSAVPGKKPKLEVFYSLPPSAWF